MASRTAAGRATVSTGPFLRFGAKVGDGLEAPGRVDVPVEEDVGKLQPAPGADFAGRELAPVDQPHEVGARDVEQVGRLLSRDLLVVGDDPDVLTSLDMRESVRNHLHDRRRNVDRWLVRTAWEHHDTPPGKGGGGGMGLL